jgi:hypothetical protein
MEIFYHDPMDPHGADTPAHRWTNRFLNKESLGRAFSDLWKDVVKNFSGEKGWREAIGRERGRTARDSPHLSLVYRMTGDLP